MRGAKEVFFIADDLGISPEANQAILHAYQYGALHGAALMMGQPGTEEAVAMVRQHPGLKVGFHWHITDSQPVTIDAWPWGNSPALAGFAVGLLPRFRDLVLDELIAQWNAFEQTGLNCNFANSHHHLHIHPFLLEAFLDQVNLSAGGWIRLGSPRMIDRPASILPGIFPEWLKRRGLRGRSAPESPDTLWGIDRTFRMNANEVSNVIRQLSDGRHEFIFHPRQITGDLDTECLLALKSMERYG